MKTSMDLNAVNDWIKDNKQHINQHFRPKYHLCGEIGWINDPNGFCIFNGIYHLFYQFHPYSSKWGPMHWGHATSKDLIKWTNESIALAPDSPWDCNGCFSGTALVEGNRISLFYTGNIELQDNCFQVQNLAYSEDGIYFDKYSMNPIIGTEQVPEFSSKKDIRDPKIILDEGIYYLLVATKSNDNKGQLLCYRSYDRINWEFLSVFIEGDDQLGDMWECPDLFKLKINDSEQQFEYDRNNEKSIDVLVVSPQNMPSQGVRFNNLHSSIFIIGNSNLKVGKFERINYFEIDCGFDFYAPQTVTSDKGEVILIAWMDMWESPKPSDILQHGWSGAMTLPRVLSFKNGKIFSNPIKTIEHYRTEEVVYNNIDISGLLILPNINGSCYELQVELELDEIEELVFSCYLRSKDDEYTLIRYLHEEHSVTLDRCHSGLALSGKRKIVFDKRLSCLKLRIFVDISSIEVFINEGEYTMTSRIYPSEKSQGIEFYSNQKYNIRSIKKWNIKI